VPPKSKLRTSWPTNSTPMKRPNVITSAVIRSIRKVRHVLERTTPFVLALFSQNGLYSPDGRQLIVGKFRRIFISFFPPFARALQKHYGISGGCKSCGASCKIMFQCPHWDESTHLCSVYEDRPNICRLFPITPADIKDRDLVLKNVGCGFSFKKPN
jgi:hypothetical protein